MNDSRLAGIRPDTPEYARRNSRRFRFPRRSFRVPDDPPRSPESPAWSALRPDAHIVRYIPPYRARSAGYRPVCPPVSILLHESSFYHLLTEKKFLLFSYPVPPFRSPLFFRKQPHASVYRQSRSKKNPAAFSQQIFFCGPHIFILTLYKVPVNSNRQQISAPAGIFFSGVTSARLPSASSAHSSMPSDRTPASFAGFKFTKTITFLPTISSAV